MISVYLLSILAGIGYYLNIDGIEKRQYKRYIKNNNQGGKPSGTNIYNNDQHDNVEKEINIKAHDRHKESKDMKKTGVVPLYHNQFNTSSNPYDDWMSSFKIDDAGQPNDLTSGVELMSGQIVKEDNFVHNNMVPFFGAKVKGGTAKASIHETILDNMQGNGSQLRSKQESAPLFKPHNNLQHINGAPNMSDFMQSRVNPSLRMANTKPWAEERIAPGLNKGYNGDGGAGFNSGMESRDSWLPKTVNELRVDTNPKMTFGLAGHEGPANSIIKNSNIGNEIEIKRDYFDECVEFYNLEKNEEEKLDSERVREWYSRMGILKIKSGKRNENDDIWWIDKKTKVCIEVSETS